MGAPSSADVKHPVELSLREAHVLLGFMERLGRKHMAHLKRLVTSGMKTEREQARELQNLLLAEQAITRITRELSKKVEAATRKVPLNPVCMIPDCGCNGVAHT